MFKKYDAYKDSGVEWIGDIPSHWEIKKLKHIGNSIIGLTYSPSDLCSVEEGTLVARSSNIFEGKFVLDRDDNVYVKSKIPPKLYLKADDILICSRNGSRDLIGKCAYIKDDSNYSFGAFTTVFRGNLNHYLFYILNSDIFKRLSGTFLTSTINQLTISNLNSISIPLPPEREMEYIKAFLHEKLSTIDQAIAIKEQQIALLNERKQIVIQKAVMQGLNPNVPMKDSGVEWIGQIPEHWKIQKLSYLAKLDSGSTPDRSNLNFWNNGTIPWLKTGEINYNLIESSEEFVTPLALSKTALKLAPKGTLLMAMYGQGITRGRVAILNFEATYNQACCAIQCKSKLINWYLFHFFVFAYSFIRDGGNETSQMNISTGYISNLKVVLPPVEEQLQIISYLDSEMEKYEEAKLNLKQQIEKLKEYKTTLINDAVTGKIKVA